MAVAVAAGVLFFASCEEEILHKGKTPLVGVGKEFLYKEDVMRFYNLNPPTKIDSATYVDRYINRWIEEALFYNSALRNVPSSADIDKLVEGYKRSLILNIYQEGLVEQHLKRDISDESVLTFYNENSAMFELEEPLAKGLFLKVPAKTPKINQLRTWCKERNEDNLEKLEKFAFANNVSYEYFAESWERLADVVEQTPLTEADIVSRLKRNKDIEFKDKEYIYFLSVDSIVEAGAMKPVELVEGEIRELLVNTLKAEFIKEKKRSIYNEALEKGTIQFYN